MKAKSYSVLLEKAIADEIFPGCSFLIIENEETTLIHKVHFTYATDSKAVSDDTIYDVASITKIVATMTLAMRLINKKIISLDDYVSKYLPEYAESEFKLAVQVRHLMTYTIDYDLAGGFKVSIPVAHFRSNTRNVLKYPLKKAPAEKYQYSNLTAYTLAEVIEKATG